MSGQNCIELDSTTEDIAEGGFASAGFCDPQPVEDLDDRAADREQSPDEAQAEYEWYQRTFAR